MTVHHIIDTARDDTKAFLIVPQEPKIGVSNMEQYNARVAAVGHTIAAASGYIRLQGELQVRKSLNRIALARAEHLYSIHRSRVEALGWKRLLSDGAEELEAYWEGGIKPEHIAALLLLVGDVTASSIGAMK